MPRIYTYLQWRDFLDDWLDERALPQRMLADWTGNTEAWASHVMSGSSRLMTEHVDPIAQGLELSEPERGYFHDLVELDSGDEHASALAFGRLLADHELPPLWQVDGTKVDWLAGRPWYVHAILRMTELAAWTEDPAWIATRLRPPILEEQAAEALAALREADLLPIAADPEARAELAVQTDDVAWYLETVRCLRLKVSTTPEYMADRFNGIRPQSMYFAHSAEVAAQLRRVATQAMEGIARLAENDRRPRTRVLELGFQMLPLSRGPSPPSEPPAAAPAAVERRLQPQEDGTANPYGVTYQEFLRKRLTARQETNRQLAAGIDKSPAWVSRILSYLLDIHHAAEEEGVVERIIAHLAFDPADAELFRNLVDVAGPNPRRAGEAWLYLLARRSEEEVASATSLDTYLQFPTWYDVAISELSLLPHFVDDPLWVSQQLVPRITWDQAARALGRMRALALRGNPRSVGTTVRSTGLQVGPRPAALASARRLLSGLECSEQALQCPIDVETALWSRVLTMSDLGVSQAVGLIDTTIQKLFGIASDAGPPTGGRVYYLRLTLQSFTARVRAADPVVPEDPDAS